MPRRSRPHQIPFSGVARAEVVEAVSAMIMAESGWVNLFPEVPDDDRRMVEPSILGQWFRAPGPPIPMATLVAPGDGRRDRQLASIGMEHGAGARAAQRLAEAGAGVPEGWKVVQDHIRRGLVVQVPDPVDAEEVVDWMMAAVPVLCPVRLTGEWLAELHSGAKG